MNVNAIEIAPPQQHNKKSNCLVKKGGKWQKSGDKRKKKGLGRASVRI